MLVRRDEFRASKVMGQRAMDNEKIEIHWNSVATEAKGDEFLSHVEIENVKTGEKSLIEANGLFYAIGHKPNTDFLNGQLELDESGYIITEPGSPETSVPGVFACGDVQDKKNGVRQSPLPVLVVWLLFLLSTTLPVTKI